jgi:aspartyl-tRNA(Asn)/glutamyl-tRNA(Gln) amidotransferase subunit A
MQLCDLNAAEMRQLLDTHKVSALELARAHLERIAAHDSKTKAFLFVAEERALADAEKAQQRIDEGNPAPMTGIPYVLKDNMATRGIRTTCASRILDNYVPPFDATVVQKLRAADAVLLGKTNLDEFAMGASTEYSGYFPSRNPWNLDCVPGGSSGGSAASVAARYAPIGFGSDTGGSVRQPAALCGIVGVKPTYGRVSRYGLVAFASSLDQIGPMARNVTDAIAGFETVFGLDPMDSTSHDMPYDAATARQPRISGLRVGVPKEMFSAEVDPPVAQVVRKAIDKMASAGAEVSECSMPMIDHGVSTYYIIAPAEASSNLARYDGVRYGLRVEAASHIDLMKSTRAKGFGNEVKERIIIGTYVLSSGYYDAYYAKANQVRALMKKQFLDSFQEFDIIVSPTSPSAAFRIGERTQDPLALKLADYCTIPASIGGFPAITLNCGFADGLPIGLQLIGNSFSEDSLFGAALGIEAELAIDMTWPEV